MESWFGASWRSKFSLLCASSQLGSGGETAFDLPRKHFVVPLPDVVGPGKPDNWIDLGNERAHRLFAGAWNPEKLVGE